MRYLRRAPELVPAASNARRAAARILRAEFLTGFFEDPCVDPDYAEKISDSPEPGSKPRRS